MKELEQYSARAKRTALGAEAPDFSVKEYLWEYGKFGFFPAEIFIADVYRSLV